jgi:hypothetical protein
MDWLTNTPFLTRERGIFYNGLGGHRGFLYRTEIKTGYVFKFLIVWAL